MQECAMHFGKNAADSSLQFGPVYSLLWTPSESKSNCEAVGRASRYGQKRLLP